jgi:1-acyl-sn-glycerol-3-phosphate acyltransferase
VALYIYGLVPEFLLRFLTWILINTIYRVRTKGLERIPEEGPVLLVCNHVSYVDALIIGGSVRRPVRFVMYYKIYRLPLLNFLFRTARTIPIAGAKEDPAMLTSAFEQISAALRNGDVVCIFPEGGLSADGQIQPFRAGIERALAQDPVPVLPLALRGLWGSMFSRSGGLPWPRKLWSRIELHAGPLLTPTESTAAALEAHVRKLREDRA